MGAIATVTFASDQGNAVITARGKGKVLSGTTLMENIVDIVEDLLTVQNAFAASLFEATRKARAAQLFTAAGYAAAGVIRDDASLWDAVERMMGSFLGSAYLDGEGLLCLDIDVGSVDRNPAAAILRHAETEWKDAVQRLENVINRCPASYGFDYSTDDFMHYSDGTASQDAASQTIYGLREPIAPLQCHWCRDATSVAALQAIVVAKFANPIYEVGVDDMTLKRLHVDINDIVAWSARRLYDDLGVEMRNQLWRVLAVMPDFGKARIGFRLQQTPYYLTRDILTPDVVWGSYLAGILWEGAGWSAGEAWDEDSGEPLWGDEIAWGSSVTGSERDDTLY